MTEVSAATLTPIQVGVDRVVQKTKFVAASPARVWEYLTTPRLLSQWFADVSGTESLVPGASFRFDFGDGDFFTGRVLATQAPWRLAIDWRFMDAGPRYTIGFALASDAPGTVVVVTDSGAVTPEEAKGLEEGWSDFLDRLARAAERNERARYEWSEQISAAALIAARPTDVMEELAAQAWWDAQRPPWRCTVHRTAVNIVVLVQHGDPEVRLGTTEATVRATELAERTYLHLSHVGWDRLPSAIRVAERRRAAVWWAALLARLERDRG